MKRENDVTKLGSEENVNDWLSHAFISNETSLTTRLVWRKWSHVNGNGVHFHVKRLIGMMEFA